MSWIYVIVIFTLSYLVLIAEGRSVYRHDRARALHLRRSTVVRTFWNIYSSPASDIVDPASFPSFCVLCNVYGGEELRRAALAIICRRLSLRSAKVAHPSEYGHINCVFVQVVKCSTWISRRRWSWLVVFASWRLLRWSSSSCVRVRRSVAARTTSEFQHSPWRHGGQLVRGIAPPTAPRRRNWQILEQNRARTATTPTTRSLPCCRPDWKETSAKALTPGSKYNSIFDRGSETLF